jgi:hypothetical protein
MESARLDTTGFVAWLASPLRRSLGTGIIVVCERDIAEGHTLSHRSPG